LLPTPIDCSLEVPGKGRAIKGRRVVEESRLIANGKVCARGEVGAVQMPEHLMPENINK
jgi:hypothetical protein